MNKKEYDKIYSRKYRLEHPQWKKNSNKKNQPLVNKLVSKLYKKRPNQQKAKTYLHYQIKIGKVIKGFCEYCGTNKNIDGHHYLGYEKENWLSVKWLCHLHHKQLHFGIIRLKKVVEMKTPLPQ